MGSKNPLLHGSNQSRIIPVFFRCVIAYTEIGGIMRLSDLQNKDIVNVEDGKKIGTIIDVVIDKEGNMESLIVQKSKFITNIFSNKDEMEVKWKQIQKIGEDVILVSLILY